jgi:hypothetical protein
MYIYKYICSAEEQLDRHFYVFLLKYKIMYLLQKKTVSFNERSGPMDTTPISRFKGLWFKSLPGTEYIFIRGSIVVKALCYKLEGHGFEI